MRPPPELHLARYADAAWRAVIRPWLERGAGRLAHSYFVVPTKGQAHAWKQRCLAEDLPLLGVEFLTPGLARKKWSAAGAETRPAMGRELLLLGLRQLLAARLLGLPPEDPHAGFWRSLQSDPERALDDFDDLLEAGFEPAQVPLTPLAGLYRDLEHWVDACGYVFAARAARAAGRSAETAPGGRLLVALPSVELQGEFPNFAALVGRCAEVSVVLPEPDFAGRSTLEERWVEQWSELLGTEPLPVDAPDPAAPVEAWWSGQTGSPVRILVGRTRADEVRLAADAIQRALAEGAAQIGVVLPRADAAAQALAAELDRRGVSYCDQLGQSSPPPLEVQFQRALLQFYAEGCRVDELLQLWPLLRSLGRVTLPLADVRRAAERSFDACQSHALEAQLEHWSGTMEELRRVATGLLPAWPEELSLAEALARIRSVCRSVGVEPPEGWSALDALAARATARFSRDVLLASLPTFLPERMAAEDAGARSRFARVTLTSRRRAEGIAWSHLLILEANAEVWPERPEASPWLTDALRHELNARRPGRLGLFTSEDRRALEAASWSRLVRDTGVEVILGAALAAVDAPEVPLAPNPWTERALLERDDAAPAELERRWQAAARVRRPEAPAAEATGLASWLETWRGRRDPTRPFDAHFFAGNPDVITPRKLSARLIERGVQDPAELWFEAVLGVRRVPWDPLVRAGRRSLGQRAHEILAAVLHPTEQLVQGFGPMPSPEVARARLAEALAERRARWPADLAWRSFQAELGQVCAVLLENALQIGAGAYVAAEAWLPEGAALDLGTRRVAVVGRLDLVRLDRPAWPGATVDIIDFKTGGDAELSVKRMQSSGASLQLGVYLAAARSLGIAGGRVWMIKPEPGAVTQLDFGDMEQALARLQWLGQALDRGVYGALTRDRSDYAPGGCDWPLACTPIPAAVLQQKFVRTFGSGEEAPALD